MSLKKEEQNKIEKVLEVEKLLYERIQALANLEYCLRLENASNIDAMLLEEYKKIAKLLKDEKAIFGSLDNSLLHDYKNYLVSKYNVNPILSDCDAVLYSENIPALRVIKKLDKSDSFTKKHYLYLDYMFDPDNFEIDGVSEKYYYADQVLNINQVVFANLMKQQLELEYRDTYFIRNFDSILEDGENLEQLVKFKYDYIFAYDCLGGYLTKYNNISNREMALNRKNNGIRLRDYEEFVATIVLDQIQDSLEELLKYEASGIDKQLHLYQLKSKKEYLEDSFKMVTEIPMDKRLRTDNNKASFDAVYNIFYGKKLENHTDKKTKNNSKPQKKKTNKIKIKAKRTNKN